MTPGLRRYIFMRILLTIPMILILVTVVFFVLRVLPGDPALAVLREGASEEQLEAFRETLGLNKPLPEQYFEFVSGLVRFDFGESMTRDRPVVDEIKTFFPATVELAFYSMFVIVGVGIFSGVYAAQKRKTAADYTIRILSIVLYSLPIFWLGIILQMNFGAKWGLLPVAGRLSAGMTPDVTITGLYTIDAILTQDWALLKDAIRHLIMPSLTLGLILAGIFTRLTRANMLEVLEEDYIVAGRARGLHEKTLVFRHGLRNALIPIVTLLGLQFAILLAGAILTETTFSWPGLGRLVVDRIFDRDFTTVQASILFFAVLVAGFSLFVDILYGFIDPRIRY
ncbi:MAG: ABC transporter permease [Chloroflexi bacterium]|jgi:peptide/nickel transport system permease protein|nr:ABC transporter permease [Chloroflexota bacterium]MBT3670366.1 ABC transporter permease [Chloroflexota bacterium]MBT4002059.1 ABC transporter permease [Chloroflexota bacterium]MBT4305553.1 ABC transporter permease [Chloroflexota bacterium]MBT4533165.1 ABC transporter permease [Chloroflexota bacterium]